MLKRKTALVTGGAVRLGREIAIHLANKGYNIALHYNSSGDKAIKLADEIKEFGVECELFALDFNKDFEELESLIINILDIYPGFNLLVNSASVYHQAPISKTDKKLLDQQFNVNFKAPFMLSRYFALYCKNGNIINILDNKIAFNQYQYASYLLSKKALADLTLMSSIEFAPEIRVNAIAPGVTLPAESRTNDYIDWRVSKIPLKKQGNVKQLMQAMDYILQNSFVTGQIMTVDGGESLTNVGFNAATFTGGDPDE